MLASGRVDRRYACSIPALTSSELRIRLLDAAERLLAASPDRDIATRDLCATVGVGAPVLYRIFGDKEGLLRALVDHRFDRYLQAKRDAKPSVDPVRDLRRGWDSHVTFALANPAVYRLMFSAAFREVPDAAEEASSILRGVLARCAASGLLTTDVDSAAQTVMSANIGVALSLVTQPQRYDDPKLSERVRDAVHRTLLTPAAFGGAQRDPENIDVPIVARQLQALLGRSPAPALSPAETGLLSEWLKRLASSAADAPVWAGDPRS